MITFDGVDYDCDVTYDRNSSVEYTYNVQTKDRKTHVGDPKRFDNITISFGNKNNTQYEALRNALLNTAIKYHALRFYDGNAWKEIECIVSSVSDRYRFAPNGLPQYTGMSVSFLDRG